MFGFCFGSQGAEKLSSIVFWAFIRLSWVAIFIFLVSLNKRRNGMIDFLIPFGCLEIERKEKERKEIIGCFLTMSVFVFFFFFFLSIYLFCLLQFYGWSVQSPRYWRKVKNEVEILYLLNFIVSNYQSELS